MTRETKVGLLMVAVVVGVFGFLIYKRVYRPIEGIAEQITRDEERVLEDNKDVEFSDDRNLPHQITPERTTFRKNERAVVRNIELAADKVEDFAEKVVDEVTTTRPEKHHRQKPRLPVELPSNDDDFAQFTEPRRNQEEPRRIQTPDPVDDAFAPPQQPTMQPPRNQTAEHRAASDPFLEETTESKVRPVQFDEPSPRESRDSSFSDPGETAVEQNSSRERRQRNSVSEAEAFAEEPRRVQGFDDNLESTSRNRHRPVPAALVEERISRETEIQSVGDRQNYVVQPNDSFWSISRKVYGAGKYSKLLALHNQQIISDPRTMRPGVVISTPELSVLVQRYADSTGEPETFTEEPRRMQEFEVTSQSATRQRRQSASDGFAEERTSRDPEIQPAVSGDGRNYVVQPNDNFWSISRKVYGAGRYYKALAMHNQKIISDPQMMRPGVVISTPEVSMLEQRYASVIPKAAAADSVTSVSTTQSRKPVESEPSGYFVSAEGGPMYRVGENDTLSGIAKSHLGRTSRWVQILEMNRNVLRDGNELKIGTVLRLPADACRVQVVGTGRDYR